MSRLRTFLHRYPALALLLVAAALAMKVAVPAGMMVGTQSKTLTIEICADTLGVHLTRQIAVPFAPPSPGKAGETGDHGKDSGACPFGALAMAALGGADAALLAAALAFILTLGIAPPCLVARERHTRLRPPLRGPPARA